VISFLWDVEKCMKKRGVHRRTQSWPISRHCCAIGVQRVRNTKQNVCGVPGLSTLLWARYNLDKLLQHCSLAYSGTVSFRNVLSSSNTKSNVKRDSPVLTSPLSCLTNNYLSWDGLLSKTEIAVCPNKLLLLLLPASVV
jgi:hypothetical protein